MTITVTSLGANHQGNYTAVSVSGIYASAGDWIVGCYSGDTSADVIYGTSGVIDHLNKIIDVQYGSNVVTELWAGKLQVDIGPAILSAVNTNSDAKSLAVYKVTDIYGEVAIPDGVASGSTVSLNQTYKRQAAGLWLPDCTISSITVYLQKTGTENGPLYVRVRKYSDDSIVGTFGSIDCSSLTTSLAPYTFNTSSVAIPSTDYYRICVETYGLVDPDTVYIETGLQPSTLGGVVWRYTSSWARIAGNPIIRMTSVTGGKYLNPLDKSSTATGTNAPYNTGSTGTLSQANEIGIAVIGIEEQTDNLGSWTTGASYISGNEQSAGATSGGAKGNSIATAAEILSATTAQEGDMNASSPDWAALIVTFLEEEEGPPPTPGVRRLHLLGVGH